MTVATSRANYWPSASVAESVGGYDAILIVSFGGPEGPDDVLPFLKNVTTGRQIPEERLKVVGRQYDQFGGVSPINEQTEQLIRALRTTLDARGITLPMYWGNRNWYPFLDDTMSVMSRDGIQRALALVTSAYSSFSSCRQYLNDIDIARAGVGDTAPAVDKVRVFYNHPGFIESMIDNVREALNLLAPEMRSTARLVFTAHSIPLSFAQSSDYQVQLDEAARLVAEQIDDGSHAFDVVFQSRSGGPQTPWLEPDVGDHIEKLKADGERCAVLIPIGFISDHMEVQYDLDFLAMQRGKECGLTVIRASTVGTAPKFVNGLVDLLQERLFSEATASRQIERQALGTRGANHDVCDSTCCIPQNL